MSNTVVTLHPPSANEHARGETERKQRLFEWADRVLQELGLIDMVSQASSFEELRKIVFDLDAFEVTLAIREALHPASGPKADCFIGMQAGSLKRLLKARFNELKRQREVELLRAHGAGGKRSTYNWTDGLKLDDKGGVRAILHNEILFLRHHPQWQGVVAYDEFSARVVIRKGLPWGAEAAGASWTDHHESLTRTWFQCEDINAAQGDVGRAVQAAARHNRFHPVRDYLDTLVWDGAPRLDTWLVTYFHAADTLYTRAIGPRWLKRSQQNNFPAKRRQRLDDLGFVWNKLDNAWEIGLSHLRRYRDRVGHCRVPKNHQEGGYALGQWVVNQRMRANALSGERRQRLDELGFVWSSRHHDLP